MAYNAGTVLTKFTAGIKNFKQGVKTIKKDLNGLSTKVSNVGNKMKSAGSKMTKGVSVPLAAVAGAAIKFGTDFEDAMTKSTSIMGELSDEMKKKMSDVARTVGTTTDKSAKEAAESYYYLASAGMDAEQAMEALPRVAQFATAGNFDMATATDLLTDAQSALGLTVDDTAQNMKNMEHVSDVLVKANKLANASVEQFSSALTNKAAASLRSYNKDVEEGTAVLAVFADQGLKGQRAGNTLARMFDYLSDSQQKNAGVWEKNNMTIYDSEGNMKNMADIVEMLEGKMKGLSDEEKTALLSKLGFNSETQKTIKLLMGTSGQIREYEEGLRNAGGTTEEVANKQMQSMKEQLGLIKDGLVDAALSIYEMLKPAIKEVFLPLLQSAVKKIRAVADWFGNLSKPMQKTIGVLVALAIAIGPVLMAVGAFLTLIGPIIPTIVAIGTAIMSLGAGPLVLIVGAIIAVIAIFKKWHKEIFAFMKFLYDVFIASFLKLPEYFPQIWGDIKDITSKALKALKEIIGNLFEKIVNIITGVWNDIRESTQKVWDKISGILKSVLDVIKTLFLNWTPVGIVIKYWDEIWDYTKEIWNKVAEFISKIWQTVVEKITNIGSKIATKIDEIFTGIKETAIQVFENITNFIKNAWSTIAGIITNSIIWKKAVSIFTDFVRTFTKAFADIGELVVGVWNDVIGFTKEAFSNIAGNLKERFNAVVNWIPEKIGQIVEGIKSFWRDAYEYLSNQDLYTIGKNLITSLAKGVSKAMNKAIEAVTNVAEGLTNKVKDLLGISSPSKVFAKIGSNVGKGIKEGIEGEENSLADKMQTIKDRLTANMNIQSPQVATAGAGNQMTQNQTYHNFQPTVNFGGANTESASEERRKQEQLLRKLGAEYNAK